jgi:putative Mg2+ transporter-C (MgtC) family protein
VTDVPSLSGWEIAARLAVAAVLAGSLGIERELREREAGLRTHLLVGLGSALFTLVSAYGFHEFLTTGGNLVRADPTRIAAQIVSGIGFLGAGAIIRQGLSVRGLTTAATLWVVAAIGMAAGAGYYTAAVATTVIALISLWPLRIAAHRLLVRFRPEEGRLHVSLPPGGSAAPLLDGLERFGARVDSLEIEDGQNERIVVATLRLEDRARAAAMLERISGMAEVRRAEWTA